jgi:hypothetical protein
MREELLNILVEYRRFDIDTETVYKRIDSILSEHYAPGTYIMIIEREPAKLEVSFEHDEDRLHFKITTGAEPPPVPIGNKPV